MISEYKKNSKFRKKSFNTHKFKLKTIAKMEKEKKILSLIQYKQYTFRCYEFIEKNVFLLSKVKISTKYKNKKFKNIKRKFVLIKKITPEKLLSYLQNEEISLIIEDLNRFSGSLEKEKYDFPQIHKKFSFRNGIGSLELSLKWLSEFSKWTFA